MEIRIHRDGTDFGPYSVEEVRQYLASGQIIATDLAWYQGAPDWMPVTQVPGVQPAPVTPPAMSATPPGMPPMMTAGTPPGMPPSMPPMMGMPVMPPAGGYVTYAGFWKRAAALLADGAILGIIGALLASAMLGSVMKTTDPQKVVAAMMGFYGIYLPLTILYFVILESGKAQATFGKRLVGIQVTNLAGERLSFLHALGRWAAKLINGFTFNIGYLIAAFTEKKQALHDLIAGTLVVNKDPNNTSVGGCAIVILLAFPVGIAMLGIAMAIAIPAYVDYTKRAKVADAVNSAKSIQDSVATYALAQRQLPSTLEDLNMVSAPSVDSVTYTVNDGTILINFAMYNVTPALFGTLALEPYFRQSDNQIVWRCGKAAAPSGTNDVSSADSAAETTIPDNSLPAACR